MQRARNCSVCCILQRLPNLQTNCTAKWKRFCCWIPCPSTPPRGHIRKSNRVYRKNSNEGADGIVFRKIKPPKEKAGLSTCFFVKRQKNGYNTKLRYKLEFNSELLCEAKRLNYALFIRVAISLKDRGRFYVLILFINKTENRPLSYTAPTNVRAMIAKD